MSMQPRDHLAAARRWAKFPATVLIIVAVLWLLDTYSKLDLSAIGQQTETGIGIFLVLVNLLLIPIGNVVIAICALFVQRWSLWAGGVFLLYPLLVGTADKIARIDAKFAAYRLDGSTKEYVGGVMTIVTVLLIWALYLLVLFHLRKALYWHAGARQWVRHPAAARKGQQAPVADHAVAPATGVDDEVCYMMPDTEDTADS